MTIGDIDPLKMNDELERFVVIVEKNKEDLKTAKDFLTYIYRNNYWKCIQTCALLSLILVREKGLYIIKTDCSGEMLSQLKKNLFNGKPIFQCGAAALLFIFMILIS